MKRKVITIEVTKEEVDALEDIFFCKLSEEQWNKLSAARHSLWKKIATAFDYEKKEAEGSDEKVEAEGSPCPKCGTKTPPLSAFAFGQRVCPKCFHRWNGG